MRVILLRIISNEVVEVHVETNHQWLLCQVGQAIRHISMGEGKQMSIREWLWSLLPDNCEVDDCQRKGVRGNENVIDGIVVCDYCHSAMMCEEDKAHWLLLQDKE